MAIGGLESKIYGAKAAGCKLVLCPFENVNDLNRILEDHPNLLDESFQVKTIKTIDEAFDALIVK